MKIFYSVGGRNLGEKYPIKEYTAYGFVDRDFLGAYEDPESVAELAAYDYHSRHDGWESGWPLDITLFTETEDCLGTFSVDRDVEPVFSARKIK